MPKKQNRTGRSQINKLRRGNRELEDREHSTRKPRLVISFQNLDPNQGQSFDEWQEIGLAAQLLKRLQQVCSLTPQDALAQQIIKNYSKVDFPPNSKFVYPKHIPEGVTWCVMHLQGKEVVAGYIRDNIFHIVFLDKDHEFWPTKKK